MNTQFDKPREVTFIDIAFVAAALMMFTKTSDVFVIFTPLIITEMFGNVQQLYGMANAFIVEGVMVALHFHPRAQYSSRATVVKTILFVISAMCQVYDSMLIHNTIAAQTVTVKAIFSNGVPLITALVVALLLWMGKLPERSTPRKKWVGFKNLGKQFRWIIGGEDGYAS